MSEIDGREKGKERATGYRATAAQAGAAAGVVILVMVILHAFYYTELIGEAQPIPFSHRVHAKDKQISCFMCHPEAQSSSRAGIPPLQTCMLCHKRIIAAYPPIKELAHLYDTNIPIVWNRVNYLPDYVYFDHEAHIRESVDCGVCHGDVKEMDRVTQAKNFDMGFCVQCHRDNDVSRDCMICHR